MTVRIPCPECGAVAGVEEQSLGRRGRCKKCGHVFALARPGGEAASAISGDASDWKGSSPARPAASPTDLPEQFGRYRIMKPLGQGGMGAVYLAHDIKLDRRVALKVPFFHPAEGTQAVQRFEREARAAATLDHPNLCPIFDVGEIDGIHYLTMPYIEGKTLSEAIPPGQAVPEAQAAAVARKLALALAEAHARGVVHRDLKPGNIMVNRRRELIIMDFGLARMAGGEDAPLTRTGHVLGTALYMAPEQAAGDIAATGPACDVYSLGVILYELLTGHRPFEGPWSLVIGLKNVMDPEPPSKHRIDLDPALDAICLKAIAKKPEDRHATMAEFADALNAYLIRASGPSPDVMSELAPSTVENPESLAAQAFAGLVSVEVSSLRGERNSARSKTEPSRHSATRPPLKNWVIVASVSALLLGAIIFYVATEKGRIKIESNDPNAVIHVDGQRVRIEGFGDPIILWTGEHSLSVKQGNVEVETRKFVIRRGDNPALIIDLAVPEVPETPGSTKKPDGKDLANNELIKSRFVPLFDGTGKANWVEGPTNRGEWRVVNRVLEGQGGDEFGQPAILVTKKMEFSNFRLRATIFNDGQGKQLLIRWTSDEKTYSGYGLMIGGIGRVDASDISLGNINKAKDRPMQGRFEWDIKAKKIPVELNEWYTLEVTAIGNRITSSINGTKVAEFTDSENSFPIGQIALISRAKTTVRYKEIVVEDLTNEAKR